MNWSELHREAELLAQEAEFMLVQGSSSPKISDLYRAAAFREKDAYNACSVYLTRTLGITAVSCVALLIKAGERDDALKQAKIFLSELESEFFCDRLRRMIEELES